MAEYGSGATWPHECGAPRHLPCSPEPSLRQTPHSQLVPQRPTSVQALTGEEKFARYGHKPAVTAHSQSWFAGAGSDVHPSFAHAHPFLMTSLTAISHAIQ
eukprot:CAMPEP_0202755956 /NCGR_PEP_ID=MMETSP1388-20130828/15355_1 /ASSEMBLY_ACC=CAM_ASM_000864 /TAXON_ID=37098 /ORGANISM="Isochrysis sp, Strain CCMP1244" /LENGTH=100 /DNA_ID=CAMNT_0049423797 /DNA_START=330 /DNA_END=632 /DNA_ORIENTATION=-